MTTQNEPAAPGAGMAPPARFSRQIQLSLALVPVGVAAALATMAIAWARYPGGYDWLNRDLSTLGRLFAVPGPDHLAHYPIYNFALLLWGAAGAVFFATRAQLLASRWARAVWLHGSWVFGLGITAAGIVPADAPDSHWHVLGCLAAAAALMAGMACLGRGDEPGRRWWRLGLAVLLVGFLLFRMYPVPHGGVVTQKLLVLYVFAYFTVQAWRLRRELRRGARAVPAGGWPATRRFAGRLLVAGALGLLWLMLSAMAAFPGGFDWRHHWTSRLGDVFLAEPFVRENVYPGFMVYNGALAVGGVALAVFWTLRALGCATAPAGAVMLVAGVLMGCGLTAIGMAPTGALGLHRLGIRTMMLTVPPLQILLLRRDAHADGAPGWRYLFLGLTAGTGLLFAGLGSGYGKLGQKALIAVVCVWLLWLGVGEARRGAAALRAAADPAPARSRFRRFCRRAGPWAAALVVALAFAKVVLNVYVASLPTLCERLGLPKDTVALIVNADDAGLHPDTNTAVLDALRHGLVGSATVMAPCPGFGDFVERSRGLDLDLGVHLTHTNEWARWNWTPVLSREEAPGLYDERGFMPRDVGRVFARAWTPTMYREAVAQLEEARRRGPAFNHIDSHMGAMQRHPGFMLAYIAVAKKYDVPLRMPSRTFLRRYGLSVLNDLVWLAGLEAPDDLLLPDYGGAGVKAYWLERIRKLRPGVTEVYIHPALATDGMRNITHSWERRSQEYEAFRRDPDIRPALKKRNVVLLGYRHLYALQRGRPIPPPLAY